MPSISVFLGIIIRMFYNDHEPPRFHAEHQGLQGKFAEPFHGLVDSHGDSHHPRISTGVYGQVDVW